MIQLSKMHELVPINVYINFSTRSNFIRLDPAYKRGANKGIYCFEARINDGKVYVVLV